MLLQACQVTRQAPGAHERQRDTKAQGEKEEEPRLAREHTHCCEEDAWGFSPVLGELTERQLAQPERDTGKEVQKASCQQDRPRERRPSTSTCHARQQQSEGSHYPLQPPDVVMPVEVEILAQQDAGRTVHAKACRTRCAVPTCLSDEPVDLINTVGPDHRPHGAIFGERPLAPWPRPRPDLLPSMPVQAALHNEGRNGFGRALGHREEEKVRGEGGVVRQ
mmetsp:Transcript_2438/g.5686  ORF Transcript_2438/g.5686 Transcript_2438/m.5686 type:complete len:221 (-) Transcript_2438:654-1316(-)